jgi:SAM-dependent methyltransferase
MSDAHGYQSDLAYVHDQGFGDFARHAAAGLLEHLREAGIGDGLIVDLGCGSGIWIRQLLDAGYQALGVDQSPHMIELARRRAPEAQLHVASFLQFPIPRCRAVTALGEVFNYTFDGEYSLAALHQVCQRIGDALSPGGLLILDVAQPGRCQGRQQAFSEGKDWTCLVEYKHDLSNHRLTRRIITFRKIGDVHRRTEEIHCQQLLGESMMVSMLEGIGFDVRPVRQFGQYALPEYVVGLIAKKPML